MEAYQSGKTNGPLCPPPQRRNEEIWLLSYIIRNTTETKGCVWRERAENKETDNSSEKARDGEGKA